MMKTRKGYLLLVLAAAFASVALAADSWRSKLRQELPLLGHRNWIVVADSAYPLQTAPGIETIHTTVDQLEVVQAVLEELAATRHVQPVIFTDAELNFVAETNAPGITAYRNRLAKILETKPATAIPHEEIIAKLDQAGKTFKILVIKTPLTKPYTSVFFQLECGYWNAESEKQLREAMEKKK